MKRFLCAVGGAGHALRRHPLDPLLASLALFDSPEDLGARIDALFKVSSIIIITTSISIITPIPIYYPDHLIIIIVAVAATSATGVVIVKETIFQLTICSSKQKKKYFRSFMIINISCMIINFCIYSALINS